MRHMKQGVNKTKAQLHQNELKSKDVTEQYPKSSCSLDAILHTSHAFRVS